MKNHDRKNISPFIFQRSQVLMDVLCKEYASLLVSDRIVLFERPFKINSSITNIHFQLLLSIVTVKNRQI